ncbi:MAG TPA: tripartite tricarboxylate transporter TctB family protein [Thermomicrobiales bacterium]|nr:tripartite tricarboxylate transporter TctB family protein [Thermomicrobiales bacterium]
MRVSETIAALCITLLGITTIGLARQLPYEAEYGPGPGFLPFWLGVTFVVLSVFLLREALNLRIGEPPAPADGERGSRETFFQFSPGGRTSWLIFFVSTIAVSLLFERLGFAVSIGLFMLVTMRWVARQSWPSTIALALATPIVLYIGFARILMVPIPLGPPGF